MIAEHVTANLFFTIEKLLFVYGRMIFDKTSGIFLGLFMIVYGCKFTWDIAYKTLYKQKLELEDIIQPILILSFLTVVMGSADYIEDWVVRPAYNLAVKLVTITAAVVKETPQDLSIVDMFNLVDRRLNQVVFEPCKAIAENAGFLQYFLNWGLFIIEGIYIMVWFLFLSLMVSSIFRFITFYAISPLIIVSLFFPQTKSIGIAGFKSLVHGILGMFMAGVAMGFTVAIIGDSPDLFYDNGKNIKSNWVFGPEYFTVLLLGLLSISFHLKSAKVSANLSNIDDGAGPEAAVAGIGMATVMSSKASMGRMGGKAGGKSARGLGKGSFRAGKWGVDKARNGKGAASFIQHMTGRVS